MKSKLIKVTFEYEDRIEILESPDPEEWLKALNGCVEVSSAHGFPMIENKWKIEAK